MDCRCDWDCSCISLCGIRRQREFEEREEVLTQRHRGRREDAGKKKRKEIEDGGNGKSGGAVEWGHGFVCLHGYGSGAAWSRQRCIVACGIWAEDGSAREAGV